MSFEYNQEAEKNKTNPYERFTQTELILRDQLAIDRTILANERTFLAYCRTGLALIIAGVGAIKLLESLSYKITGWGLIVLGIVVAAIGSWRSIIMFKNIKSVGRGLKDHPDN